MRTGSRLLFAMLAALCLTLSFSQAACWGDEVYRDPHGHAYRHERWHDEHVYQHEDGRWYAQRNNTWVVVEGVDIR